MTNYDYDGLSFQVLAERHGPFALGIDHERWGRTDPFGFGSINDGGGIMVHALILLALVATPPAGEETPQGWFRAGGATLEQLKTQQPVTGKAKNVILFIGDGMGVSTVTAARILEGQQRGRSGEENFLSFERLPYTALIKTYSTDLQTPDSAGTMSAIVTGVKTNSGVLSVNQRVALGDAAAFAGNQVTTILELAERAGLSTGVVTTTRITHATPAACYAHSPHRDWEDDSSLPPAAKEAGIADLARQLIEFDVGDGLEVALGGGRANFLPEGATDPEYSDRTGRRLDGRDLTAEWLKRPKSAYVWNRAQFDALDPAKTGRLLGLFQPSHVQYEHDRPKDPAGEPSLSEMTGKAIDLLSHNPKGYFLMVEGGRIDHAHHETNAFRALTDTIELAAAVEVAMKKSDRKDTLLIVTADHSHVFTMAGYPPRGNPILGKVTTRDEQASHHTKLDADKTGKPFTTLGYANGPGPVRAETDLSKADTEHPDYRQEVTVPLESETHGGEDVPLYADGPQAHLFRGVLEQNVIFHVMTEALGLQAASP